MRLSTTMRGEPQITEAEGSPVRSVHLTTMLESLNSEAGFAPQSSWDHDSSSDGDMEGRYSTERPSTEKAHPGNPFASEKPRRSSEKFGRSEQQSRTSSDVFKSNRTHAPNDDPGLYTFYSEASSAASKESIIPPIAYTTKDGRQQSYSPPQSSKVAIDGNMTNEESPILPRTEDAPRSIIAQVHAMTLQSLERIQSDSPRQQYSMTPPQPLSVHRWMNTRPMSEGAPYRSVSAPVKKVSVVPPPIDTSTPKRLHPSSVVRTPHPTLQRSFRKDFTPSPLSLHAITPSRPSESILTLSIRRRNPAKLPIMTTMTIGSLSSRELKFAQLEKTHPFNVPDFDDQAFFNSLRTHYTALIGPLRLFSALKLSRITVSGSATRAADAGYGWLAGPRSPRAVAWKGLSDSFSEEKLLYYFRYPGKVGKERFAWVGWAERIAAAPSGTGGGATRVGQIPSLRIAAPLPRSAMATPTPGSANLGSTQAAAQKETNIDTNRMSGYLVRKADQHEGLEFVLSWAVSRIMLALVTVMALSLAAALLWIFLGVQSSSASIVHPPGTVPNLNSGGGFRNAGDRVGTGVLMGICTLLVGLTGMGGWIGVSYLML